ncbi:MAG: Lrp/AsnC family transcriptional regulator [Proteobacteria bacterium]|jgi:DNA-binding Lrp family transcriptional regulator|nr:Lrp/AsnC family transcriptional regulator [Pseudomonadota bacterium]
MTISLDKSDKKILDLIQKDATLTNQQIAEITGVSATSVWRRIKNLEDVGIIKGTVALLDQQKTNLNVCVIIHVKLSRRGEDTRIEFEKFIEKRREVIECYAILGNHDYSLTVVVPTVERFEKFLAGHLLSHPLISESTSFFTLRQVKYSTALPLD